jgi:hypothetical protein
VLSAAFGFLQRCGRDYYSVRLLSHVLLHCQPRSNLTAPCQPGSCQGLTRPLPCYGVNSSTTPHTSPNPGFFLPHPLTWKHVARQGSRSPSPRWGNLKSNHFRVSMTGSSA